MLLPIIAKIKAVSGGTCQTVIAKGIVARNSVIGIAE